jgi:ribosomal protein L32
LKGDIVMADFFGNLKGSLKGNLENLGKTLSDTAEAVSKKTKEEVEVQKIKSQVRGMERSNERDFQDIGKMIYDKFKKGEVVDTAFIELCEAIEGREQAIEEAGKKVAELKGLDVCPNCKEHVNADVVFCPKCGTKMEEEIIDVEETEDIFEEVVEEVKEIVEEVVEEIKED